MNNVTKVMECTAKFFSVDNKCEIFVERDRIRVEYNSKDIDLEGDINTRRVIVLQNDNIYFYCYNDNTLRNNMSLEEFMKIHSNKVKNDTITTNDIDLYGYSFVLSSDNKYYLEYKDIYYCLDTINNKLIATYNDLDKSIINDIDISNEVKHHIINRCLDDLPF